MAKPLTEKERKAANASLVGLRGELSSIKDDFVALQEDIALAGMTMQRDIQSLVLALQSMAGGPGVASPQTEDAEESEGGANNEHAEHPTTKPQ
eukprot:a8538_32.p3 GENE.a8538_32~~a8538_32.p3  ORF type:complete len:103 (+),score=22.91 a8538_32:30-311(+)